MTHRLLLVPLLAGLLAICGTVSGDEILFNSTFDGDSFPAGFTSQGGNSVSGGNFNLVNFQRAVAGATINQTDAITAGDMFLFEAVGLTLNDSAGGNNPTFSLGLSTGTDLGNATNFVGGQIVTSDGVNLFVDNGSFGASPNAVDTGLAVGSTFDYTVKITAESTATVTTTTYTTRSNSLLTAAQLHC